MNILVTRTKYILPRRRADLLSRPRLLDLMANLLEQKLVILAAPAGYGKTSLLIDTAYHTSLPACWYAIDPLDREFKRFAAYFIASINHKFPAFGQQSNLALEHLSQINPDIDQFVTILVNDLFDNIQEHFLVILDDYHFLDDQPEISQFIGSFIQAVDENCHLVISSRTLLSLPDLPLMVARSQVGGLSLDELAFKPDEIRALIDQNYHQPISDQLAKELAEETEGWITGLLLSTQSRWQGTPDRLRTARVSAVGLYDYLAQQVLDQQSPAVRDFLLRTSLLEEFDAQLCEDVFGPPAYPHHETWSGLLEITLRNNLFVLPVGEKGLWLRYHHLFRDFLQSKLTQENPELERQIAQKLAQVYVRQEEWDKAYNLFFKLGDNPGLVELIERAGSNFLHLGRLKTLASWIDALPPWELSNNPRLLSLRGSVAVMTGEVERGLVFLNHSEAALRQEGNLVELARTLPRRAHAYQYLGKYEAALSDADEAVRLCGDDPRLRPIKALALRARGLNLYRLGKRDDAILCLKESAGIYDILGNTEDLALVDIDLGMVYQATGAYTLSKYAYESARNSLTKIGDLSRLAAVQNNLGVLYHVQGRYEQAATYFEQALEMAKQSGFAYIEALTLASIGDLYRDLDALEAAEEAYARAHEIAERIEAKYILFYLQVASASIAYQADGLQKAQEYLAEASRLAHESHSLLDQAYVNMEHGRILLLANKTSLATPLLQSASETFEAHSYRIETTRASLYLASAHLAAGQSDDAATCLFHAFSQAAGMENQHFLVSSARDIKPLLAYAFERPEIMQPVRKLLQQVDQFEAEIPGLRRRLRHKTSSVPFAPPRLIIQTFNRSQVLLDGKSVQDFGSNSQIARDLFFLLLAHPEGMGKETIGAILWPDSTVEQLRFQFKNAIYRLRRSLQQNVIILDGECYKFNHALDYEFDLEIFEKNLSIASSSQDRDARISAYQAALHVYKGPFLADMSADWIVPMREQLNQRYIQASLALGDLCLESGDTESASRIAQYLIKQDACLEAAHRLSMRIHASLGNIAGMVRQYEACRSSLKEDFDLPPSSQTTELYEQLLTNN